ncbi:MAG: hypothetical protein ACPGVU_02395, partial [Limisphaerales bacterium]
MIRKLITVCTLLLCVTSPAPGQSFSIESYLSDLTGASTNSILKSIYNADPETLNKILSHTAPPGYRSTQPRSSKLDPFLPIIHEIL